jgi:hypothetical protein
MDKTRRALESEKTSSREYNESVEESDVSTNGLRESQQFVFNYKGNSRVQRKFEENHEDSHKGKKKLTSHNEENHYSDSRERPYGNNSKAHNNSQHGDYRKYYKDELQFVNNRGSSKSSTFTDQNQYIDPQEQQLYNEKREDHRRDNYFTRLPNGNNARMGGSFSYQEDGGQFPYLFRRQRQFFGNMEEGSDVYPRDLRQSPARDRRISQYSNESQDNVYTHIRDRKQYHCYTYDNSEGDSDRVGNREELNSGEQSTSLRQVRIFFFYFFFLEK